MTSAGAAASAASWAASGGMALTGWPGAAPLLPAGDLAGYLERLVADIEASTAGAVRLDWGGLLCGRAAALGLRRRGRTSANGSCRLLRAADGWAAFNLARPDDLDAVGAVVGATVDGEPWAALERFVSGVTAASAVARARLLGLPAAELAQPAPGPPVTVHPRWSGTDPRPATGLRVVDLSSMWAGPLAARILMAAGAEVVKVESADRRDGARGHATFFEWLHPPGQAHVVVDWSTGSGRRRLRDLLEAADVVVEGSRPRALEQLGAGPDHVGDRPGRVWCSVTGYGRGAPGRDWVAFGDDAAVGGGLVAWDAAGEPVFCADAVADPLTGLVAAAAVLRSLQAGGGQLLDVAMSRAAAAAAARALHPVQAQPVPGGGWELPLAGGAVAVREPWWPGEAVYGRASGGSAGGPPAPTSEAAGGRPW